MSRRSRYGNADGPRPIWVVGLLAGLGLVVWGFTHASVHLVWQVPLGLWMVVGSMGKMSAR